MSLVDTRTPDPKRLISGATGDWEIIIGLEVHAQVTSNSKLFSGASTDFGKADPNSNVSLVDAAMPGMLPVINEECVAQAVRTGLGLKAQINNRSVFDRKNYFYPDLPQGYQISQFKHPIVGEGDHHLGRHPDRQASSRTSRSASSVCTSSRTPASRCTTSIRRCPMSISTARASR
jgi:aspartyl-tRNA(Asn)/glutamyl-tRNA(Gln) amidotransferase subunit B